VGFRFVPQQALAVVAPNNVDIDLVAETSLYTHPGRALRASVVTVRRNRQALTLYMLHERKTVRKSKCIGGQSLVKRGHGRRCRIRVPYLFVVELEGNASNCTLLYALWPCVSVGRLQWLHRTMVVLI